MYIRLLALAYVALAARPFLNEPLNGYEELHGDVAREALPPLKTLAGLPDFEQAARNYLPLQNYTYYRNAAGGEWSNRNNMEVFSRYSFQPRVLIDSTDLASSMSTTILGHIFSSPFLIAPAARANYGHPNAEQNFVQAAGEEGILYVPSLLASNSIEEISLAKAPAIRYFSRCSDIWGLAKSIQASRWTPEVDYTYMTWETYEQLKATKKLPIVVKGILTVQDAKIALDGAPSSMEVALAIHREAPEIFQQTEVYADGGVRYGTDVLKLLSLGVNAVGIARPFMYANVYGLEGVKWAIKLLKRELLVDAANLGVPDLSHINASYVN